MRLFRLRRFLPCTLSPPPEIEASTGGGFGFSPAIFGGAATFWDTAMVGGMER
jgi:hypothetical protein